MTLRTFQDYMFELQERFPACPPREAERLVWRAVKDICNELELSFMIGSGRIVVEASYNTGTISATNGSTTVTLTGGTWDTSWTQRRLRIQGRSEEYLISAFPDAATATLDLGFLGATSTGLTYQMYRTTYSVPADCEFSRELMIWDPVNRIPIDLVDFLEFERTRKELALINDIPRQCARTALTAAGVPQLIFGPGVPSTPVVYEIDYYKTPVKPATVAAPLSPVWPDAFNDVIPLRAAVEYADRHALSRRSELRQMYIDRKIEMVKHFDGRAEMERRIRSTYPVRLNGWNLFGGRYSG